jgi:O-antigen/teichoic acid export membrane protein
VRTTLTNATLFFLGILIWIATARFLSTHLRGLLALIMVVPGLVIRIGLLGMEQGTVVMAGGDRKLLSPLARTGVWFGLLLGLLMIGVMLGLMYGSPFVFRRITQMWPNGPFLFITLAFPIHLVTIALDSAIYAEDRIAARNAKELVVNGAMLAVMLVAFFGFGLQLFAVVGAYLVANLVSLVYAAMLLIGHVRFTGGIRIDLAKDAIRLGFPINLAQTASYMMLPAMMILLSLTLGGPGAENLQRIGFFAIGFQMVDRILPVTRSVAFALLPKITGGTGELASELAAKASRHTLMASLILFAVLVLLSHIIVGVLLGPRYLPAASAFVIMAPGGVVLSAAGVWSAHLLAVGRPYRVAWASLTGVVVALILSGVGFRFIPDHREVLVASVAVAIGSLVNASVLLPAFCSVAGVTMGQALVLRAEDVREWNRIPGLLRELVKSGGKDHA